MIVWAHRRPQDVDMKGARTMNSSNENRPLTRQEISRRWHASEEMGNRLRAIIAFQAMVIAVLILVVFGR